MQGPPRVAGHLAASQDLKHGSHNSNQVARVCIPDKGGKARKTSQKLEKRQIDPLFPISLTIRLQKTGLSTSPQKTVCETPSLPVPFQTMPCYLVPRTLDVIH